MTVDANGRVHHPAGAPDSRGGQFAANAGRAGWVMRVSRRLARRGQPARPAAKVSVKEYEGEEGNRSHITRVERGMIPTSWVRDMPGVNGERPGEHRNRQGAAWEDFKQALRSGPGDDGIKAPLFITVDHGSQPRLSEGNHRRDAYVELGATHVPAEIRYFGHAERQGTVGDRLAGPDAASWVGRTVARLADYRMQHQPPNPADGDVMRLDDLETDMPDVYEHPDWYASTHSDGYREAVRAMRAARGNPDGMVTIYRSAPPGVEKIRPGDWVTTSRGYAAGHGRHGDDAEQDWPVIAMQVPVRHVFWGGNDIMEFGYWPRARRRRDR